MMSTYFKESSQLLLSGQLPLVLELFKAFSAILTSTALPGRHAECLYGIPSTSILSLALIQIMSNCDGASSLAATAFLDLCSGLLSQHIMSREEQLDQIAIPILQIVMEEATVLRPAVRVCALN